MGIELTCGTCGMRYAYGDTCSRCELNAGLRPPRLFDERPRFEYRPRSRATSPFIGALVLGVLVSLPVWFLSSADAALATLLVVTTILWLLRRR